MLNAIFAAALAVLSVGESHSVKIDDRTEAEVTLRKDALQINWNCAENNMEYVNNFYRKSRWDVFSGESVDCTFSPFARTNRPSMGFPDYRLLTNPSNTFFAGFYGKPRPSAAFTSKTVRGDKGWTVEWVIPFAALETSKYPDAASEKTFMPGNVWSFKFSRRSESGGKKSVASSPVAVFQFPPEVLAPYRQIMLICYRSVKSKKAGDSVISCALRNTAAGEFIGKAKLYLHAGKEISLLKEIALKIPAKGAMRIDQPVTLPEKAAKFKIRTVIEDQNGLPVRISYDLPIENPWVEF